MDLFEHAKKLNELVNIKFDGNIIKAWEEENGLFQEFGLKIENSINTLNSLTKRNLFLITEIIKEEYNHEGFDYGLLASDFLCYLIDENLI